MIFWKKGPDCVHICVQLSIHNVVFRVSRWKKCVWPLLLVCDLYWSALIPQTSPHPCPEKFLVVHLHSGIIIFAKHSTLIKCLTVFWMCLCLNKCSVICTVTLCYVLHQKHLYCVKVLEYSVLCFSMYIQSFSIIEAYSLMLRHY